MLGRLKRLLRRPAGDPPYAGVLVDWTACRDCGGVYYRGRIEHDHLGRFPAGARMSTGYVTAPSERPGVIVAGDACYELSGESPAGRS
jgi:hypothetical protein